MYAYRARNARTSLIVGSFVCFPSWILFLSDGWRDNDATTGYSDDSSEAELGVVGSGLHISPNAFCVPLRGRWADWEPAGWWMESPLASSLPFPDLPHLIAFPGFSFAGNGLKHDMSLTRCLPKERESIPPQQVGLKSQRDRPKHRGLVWRAD